MIADKFSVIAEPLVKILHAIVALCASHSEVYMERKPILRMPRILRGVVTLPPAPDYGKPKKLDSFREASGRITGAGSEWKIMDYGGLTIVEHRIGSKTWAQVFESTSGLLVVGGSLNISGKVRAFRSAIVELNTFVDWAQTPHRYKIDRWQMEVLADKIQAWIYTKEGKW